MKQDIHEGAVDLFLIFQFIKRLTTPWDKTEAFKLGLLDGDGKKLKKASTKEEKEAVGLFDRLVFNLKRLLEKVPGGKTRIATYAAALLLIREENEPTVDPDNLFEIKTELVENMQFLQENFQKDYKMMVEEIANVSAGGEVAGLDDKLERG